MQIKDKLKAIYIYIYIELGSYHQLHNLLIYLCYQQPLQVETNQQNHTEAEQNDWYDQHYYFLYYIIG